MIKIGFISFSSMLLQRLKRKVPKPTSSLETICEAVMAFPYGVQLLTTILCRECLTMNNQEIVPP